jgi:hypothetical protein
MYLGVQEALNELGLEIPIYTLEDIENTFNPQLKFRDFFKVDKLFLKNCLLFDNLPYDKARQITEYLLKLNKEGANIVFALACAGFTANSFLNKYDLLYIYIAGAKFVGRNNEEKLFPTAIICNDINKICSNQNKKNNLVSLEKFRNKQVLSTTDVFAILKCFDIDKEKIIKLSNDFFGGILIHGFSNVKKETEIKKYKDFYGIVVTKPSLKKQNFPKRFSNQTKNS